MADERFANWAKNSDGMITVCQLVRWATGVYEGMGAIVRLEFVRAPDQIGKTFEYLQLGMSIDEARKLGTALLNMAEHEDRNVPRGAIPS